MRTFYPPIDPFDTFFLSVGPIHTLYVEQVGNPNGIPIIFVHGGPGGGLEPNHRRYFDPKKWRVILFDQRGCGKSTPHGSIEENTTWNLVADMECIRQKLAIKTWHVFGGSWGSTLSLAYAEKHPECVDSLVLRGIFLLRKQEINWFYQYGTSEIYPDAWEDFLAPIPKTEHGNLLEAYYQRLTNADPLVIKAAAKAWSVWEGRTSKLIPDTKMVENFANETFSYAFARIECHYFYHKGFFTTDNWLLENVNRIGHIPIVIVQGRYDMPCPMRSAWDLHRASPQSELKIIANAGHSASETGIIDALITATDRL
jgi:proline iminopeptidase